MKRQAWVAIGLVAGLAAGAGVVTRSGSGGSSTAGTLHLTNAIVSTGNDTSRPLRDMEGREAGRDEAERERESAGEADVPSREGDGETEAEREAGNEKKRELMRRVPKRVEAHRPDTALQSHTAAPVRAMPSPATSFDGIDFAHSFCPCSPPDTNGEVGRNDFVQMVNTAIAVYDKQGNIRAGFPKPINALWDGFDAGPECRDNNDGDPVLMYDQLANRWLVTQFALEGYFNGTGINFECIAVSKTGDPTGAYHRYQFPYTTGLLNDYPKFGVWPDAYYATYNNFSNTTTAFMGAGVVAYDRAKMLQGKPATRLQINIPASYNEGGMLPADLDGARLPAAGAPAPIVEMQDSTFGFAQDRVMIRRFHADFARPANSTLSAPKVLANAQFDSNLCDYDRGCIPQAGSSNTLDAISDRIMFRAAYRVFADGHDSLLINGTVDANGSDLAGIRWTELTGATGNSPRIVQQGTYAPDGDHRWMGSIAQNGKGDMALGYSVSSKAVSPSIRYTGRRAGDPKGVMTRGEATLVNGSGSQNGSPRWGDYSDMTVDPVDDCTFWYTTEYTASKAAVDWRTRIGSFRFPGCAAG